MFKLQTSSAGPEEMVTPMPHKKEILMNVLAANGSGQSPKSFNASDLKSHSTI